MGNVDETLEGTFKTNLLLIALSRFGMGHEVTSEAVGWPGLGPAAPLGGQAGPSRDSEGRCLLREGLGWLSPFPLFASREEERLQFSSAGHMLRLRQKGPSHGPA
ncbi:hypothetical protein DUI87_11268 [Hirundo rustica rustica]|uniref:Uncharacterized protein n=1 Tax=Hirundo rustica rustica TaxID=333673 RepID=A0A3M0KFZ8_HIRRU|nr:hypothetical protein DUI87_11268 [Hirundo rustica rustica]